MMFSSRVVIIIGIVIIIWRGSVVWGLLFSGFLLDCSLLVTVFWLCPILSLAFYCLALLFCLLWLFLAVPLHTIDRLFPSWVSS